MLRVVAAFLAVATILVAQPPSRRMPPPPAQQGPVDGVRIVEVLPSQLAADQEQEVFVRVRYELKSRDDGEIGIGFNTHSATGFRVFSKESITRGEGEVVLSARVTPRDWGKFVFFQAYAMLSEPRPAPPPRPQKGQPPPPPQRFRPLAVDHMPVPLAAKKS